LDISVTLPERVTFLSVGLREAETVSW